MDDFLFYIDLGQSHILDPQGYDHILFVVSLCVVYSLKDWKNVAWLVTAFTVGHSLTLALATLGIVKVNSEWVEFLIPVTILITSVSNFWDNAENKKIGLKQRYMAALFFGFIHGLGFSNFLRSILSKSESLFLPLLYFNTGLEVGQLLIVFVTLLVSWLVTKSLKVHPIYFIRVVSGIIALVSLQLIVNNWVF